jgi:hypothetical protein
MMFVSFSPKALTLQDYDRSVFHIGIGRHLSADGSHHLGDP